MSHNIGQPLPLLWVSVVGSCPDSLENMQMFIKVKPVSSHCLPIRSLESWDWPGSEFILSVNVRSQVKNHSQPLRSSDWVNIRSLRRNCKAQIVLQNEGTSVLCCYFRWETRPATYKVTRREKKKPFYSAQFWYLPLSPVRCLAWTTTCRSWSIRRVGSKSKPPQALNCC